MFIRRSKKRKTMVFFREFVSMMDTMVTGLTECSLIGRAKNSCFVFMTDVALDLHLAVEEKIKVRSRQLNKNGLSSKVIYEMERYKDRGS